MKPIRLQTAKTKLELLNFGSGAPTITKQLIRRGILKSRWNRSTPKLANIKVAINANAYLVCLLLHLSAPYSSLKKILYKNPESAKLLLLYSLYKPVKKHKPVDEKAENLPTCREEAYFQTKAFKYTTTLKYLLSILWFGWGWSRLWLNGVCA